MGSTPSIETVTKNWLSVSVAFYSFPGVDHFDFCAFIAFLPLELGLLCVMHKTLGCTMELGGDHPP